MQQFKAKVRHKTPEYLQRNFQVVTRVHQLHPLGFLSLKPFFLHYNTSTQMACMIWEEQCKWWSNYSNSVKLEASSALQYVPYVCKCWRRPVKFRLSWRCGRRWQHGCRCPTAGMSCWSPRQDQTETQHREVSGACLQSTIVHSNAKQRTKHLWCFRLVSWIFKISRHVFRSCIRKDGCSVRL